MAKDTTINMTEGSTVKHLLTFSVPMLIGNVFQQFYNLVDSMVVGRVIGSQALASIGATTSVTFLFFALCNGIGTGGGIITSQNFGRGDESGVKSCITNTAYIMLVFPLVLGIIAYNLTESLLIFLDTPSSIMADSVEYMQIMCLGLIFVSVYNYISAMLRALGDSRTPLYFLIFACVLNAILDIIFVKYLNMGVRGAAVATLFSQFLSGALCIAYALRTNPYFRLTKADLLYKKEVVLDTLKLGIPLSLQYSLIAVSCMALQKVVNSFGEVAVAAFTATSRIEQLIHQPYQTLATALSTYSGQNYGANKKQRLREGMGKGMLLMAIYTLLMVPVMQFLGGGITGLFVEDAAVIAMGGAALRITSWWYISLGALYVIRGVLSGLGDSVFALINGLVEVAGRLSLPFILTAIPFIGVWGVWWSGGIVWFLAAITAWWRYGYMRKKLGLMNL